MQAPALFNPVWFNTCTYVPQRRLIFSPHSEQARQKKKRKMKQGEKEGGDGKKTDQGGWYLLNGITALTRNTHCPSVACLCSLFPFTAQEQYFQTDGEYMVI